MLNVWRLRCLLCDNRALLPVRHLNTYAFGIYAITILLLLVVLLLVIQQVITTLAKIGPVGIKLRALLKFLIRSLLLRFFYNNRLSSAYQLRDLCC